VLVLRSCGPKGYPGMPEVSNMPLPKKLLAQGDATWYESATAG
jgi:dihydroxy-acid dehydratase